VSCVEPSKEIDPKTSVGSLEIERDALASEARSGNVDNRCPNASLIGNLKYPIG
jgi:hypothetical protein